MDKKEIKKTIRNGEDLTTEFKSSASDPQRIAEIICSFANAKGGCVLIGVSDTGQIIGIDIGQKTIERLTDIIVDNTDPKIYPEVASFKLDDKNIIVIRADESYDKPHLAHGKSFIRVGKNTKPMSRSEYERLLLKKKPKIFDDQICTRATLNDINPKKVVEFLSRAREARGFEVDPKMPVKETLERLGLISNNKLLAAALLLLGRAPQKFLPQAKVRCGRLKGINGLDFIDMKVLEGTILDLRDGAMKFVTEHINHGVFFDANRRYDKWEYPLRALEEILTNALAHRDYFSNADVQLSIYDDRIEVWNPGGLPKPLTPKDLMRKHKSIPRNKLLADKLFLIKYIEQWGKGTNRVIEEMKEAGLPEPAFQCLSGGFEVTLRGPGKSFEKEIEKGKLNLLEINQRQTKAMEYLKKEKRLTKQNYCLINKIGETYAKKELKELLQKQIIKKIGKGKNTYYILVTE